MNENIQILEAKLWGAVDSTTCKGYSLKKALQVVRVKAEMFMPNINNETIQAVLKFARIKRQLNEAMEDLSVALYKQRGDIPTIKQQINSCTETIEEEPQEEAV